MKDRKNILIRILVSAAGILAIAAMVLGFRLRGSVPIRAGQTKLPSTDVTIYRQDDPL